MNKKGITLVETLIYLAIVSVLLVALINFGSQITLSRVKAQSLEEVQHNARYALQRISIDVHNTPSINVATYDDYLYLDMDPSTTDDDIIYTLNNQQLTRQVGTETAVAISSDKVQITNLVFTEIANEADFRNLKIEITVQDVNYGSRTDFNNQTSLETALTLRQ